MRFRLGVLFFSVSFLLVLLLQTLVLSVVAIQPPPNGVNFQVYGTVKKQGTTTPVSGALIKIYADGVYRGFTYTSSQGYFSQSILAPPSAEIFSVQVSKSGYQMKVAFGAPDIYRNVNLGVVYLSLAPYSIHGYVRSVFNEVPRSDVTVTLYRDGYEGWNQIATMSVDENGYYSYTYSPYDVMTQCRVVATASTYYPGANTVSVSSTDIDMGTLILGSPVIKYAVIVGVSDYADPSVRDLPYSDNDVWDWYYYLLGVENYEMTNIWVYGDGHLNNYPWYDGDATESNVEARLESVVALADKNDIICFIMSGHGGLDEGVPDGEVFFGMWDFDWDTEDGKFRDSELAAIFESSAADTNFLFLSCCHAGGFGPELMALDNAENILLCAACSWDGVGYEYPLDIVSHVGEVWTFPEEGYTLWTYYFLKQGLELNFGDNPLTTMNEAFDWARLNYPEWFDMYVCTDGDGSYNILTRIALREIDLPAKYCTSDPSSDFDI